VNLTKIVTQTLITVTTLSILTGCAGKPSQPPLPQPSEVPKEQWSDAMNILLTEMLIEGQRDIPYQRAVQNGFDPNSGRIIGGMGDVAIGMAGYASPPTGMSGGAALGLGLGLALLGNSSAPPAGYIQVAAFVPADKASSPAEAAQLFADEWQKVRASEFDKLSDTSVPTAQYPNGSGMLFDKFSDIFARKPRPFVSEAKPVIEQVGGGEAYGPIFLLQPDTQITDDEVENADYLVKQTKRLADYSKKLPKWVFIYFPGITFPESNASPAGIYNQGLFLPFITKPSATQVDLSAK